jgi:hypothetical protein
MSREKMSQKALFEKLGAPLKNFRWSWGGKRISDGAVFLRVWKDEIDINRKFMRVTKNKLFHKRVPKHPGYRERLEHLALIRNGALSYMVICFAKDVHAIPRSIKSFNSDYLYLGGKLKIDAEGDSWLEIIKPAPVRDIITSKL